MRVEHVVEKKKSYLGVAFVIFIFSILFTAFQALFFLIWKSNPSQFFLWTLVSSFITISMLTNPENQGMFSPIEVEEVVHKVTK